MNTVICLDLETTSRAPKENEIVEVGLVKIEHNSICDTRTWCVKPEQSVPQFIYKLTGLTPKDINTAPSFKHIAEDIINFIGNHTIVAHNASFDINQLNKSLTDYGFQTLKNEVIDTQDLSKILFPTIKSYKQGQLCDALGIQQQTLHRALDDAIGVAELYITLMKEIPKLKAPIQNLISRTLKQHPTLASTLCLTSNSTTEVPIENYKDFIISAIHSVKFPTKAIHRPSISTCYEMLAQTEGYEHRPQQEVLSSFIDSICQNKAHGIVEAETGSGKTCAYLIPAVLKSIEENAPAVIATKTKLLQNQLFNKDSQTINKLFNNQLNVTVLKGKENYCDLKQIDSELRLALQPNYSNPIEWCAIMNWILTTKTGELDELHPSLYERYYQQLKYKPNYFRHIPDRLSFYKYAKDKAKESHIVITNHALLLNDYIGGHQTLPKPATVIIDEAHNLDSVATSSVAIKIDKHRVTDTLHNFYTTHKQAIFHPIVKATMGHPDQSKAQEILQKIEAAAHHVELCFKTWQDSTLYLHNPDHKKFGRKTQIIINEDCLCTQAWPTVVSAHHDVINELDNTKALLKQLKSLLQNAEIDHTQSLDYILDNHIDQLDFLKGDINYCFSADNDSVAWIEINERKYSQNVSFHCTPIFCSNMLAEQLFSQLPSSICCSASLSVNKSFDFFSKMVGLDQLESPVETIQIQSDFNHPEQAKIMCLSDDSNSLTSKKLSNYIAKCAREFKGKTLGLFTSFESLLESKRDIQKQLSDPYINVIAQSPESQTSSLITKFKSSHFPSILLGVDSFWEGMDIKGPALSCVIITKLPFHVPTDPLHASRLTYYQNNNENGFKEYSLPLAILKLKQGIGRLIRSKDDTGIIFILDPRLGQKSYKKCFIREIDQYPIEEGPFAELLKSSISWYHNQRLSEKI